MFNLRKRVVSISDNYRNSPGTKRKSNDQYKYIRKIITRSRHSKRIPKINRPLTRRQRRSAREKKIRPKLCSWAIKRASTSIFTVPILRLEHTHTLGCESRDHLHFGTATRSGNLHCKQSRRRAKLKLSRRFYS